MESPNRQLLTVCAELTKDDKIVVDSAGLIRRLLLFDRVILQSRGLREFGVLAGQFGADGLLELMRSDALRVQCRMLTVGQIGQTQLGSRAETPPLPLNSFSFVPVTEADRGQYLRSRFREIDKAETLQFRQMVKLKREVASRLVDPIPAVQGEMIAQLNLDLERNAPIVGRAVEMSLRLHLGVQALPRPVRVTVERIRGGAFRAESNLHEFGLDSAAEHKVIESGLLAVGGLNQHLAEMKHYGALASFSYRDLPVFDEKVAFLSQAQAPEALEQKLTTIVELPGLPNFQDAIQARRLDLAKLVEVRESSELKEFRGWLKTADASEVSEMSDRLRSVNAALGAAFHSTAGTIIRFVASTGVGLAAPAAAVAMGALDSFLGKVIHERRGPILFLKSIYPSIFRKQSLPDI
jgi:hypothetical protein